MQPTDREQEQALEDASSSSTGRHGSSDSGDQQAAAIHLKYLAISNGATVRRTITCFRPELGGGTCARYVVDKRTRISSNWKQSFDYLVYADHNNSKSSQPILRMKLYSDLVLWVRDGEKRYLGSVRVENGGGFSALDALGRPCVQIQPEWYTTTKPSGISGSNDAARHHSAGRRPDAISYRCSKTGLVLATCRVYQADLKPRFKSIRVITLDFRPNIPCTTNYSANDGWYQLCFASLALLEAVIK